MKGRRIMAHPVTHFEVIGKDGKKSQEFYVQVLDLVETLRKAESLGGAAIAQPVDVPGGPTVAQMADPEGNIIGLVKQ
jgi:predicted enzyme related to lactoylglutathione lyase